jgi:hypothetical protein
MIPVVRGIAVCAVAMIFPASIAMAAVVGYSDLGSFSAALPGPATVLDFDAGPNGQLIPSGGTYGGITFSYSFSGVSLKVTDAGGAPSTSAPYFLGTNDADILLDGDDISFSFAPSQAFGISIISLDSLFDGDLWLRLGSFQMDLVAADVQATLSDGSSAWFLGVVSDSPISSIDLLTIGGGFFLYNLDDVRTAPAQVASVPEPSALLIFGFGLALLGVKTRFRPVA